MEADFERHQREAPGTLWVPGRRAGSISANDQIEHRDPLDAFPEIPAPHDPLGNIVLVQLRMAAIASAGGVKLSDIDRQIEKDNTQIGRVISLGPLAFKFRDSGSMWPEGSWCAVGDFVRVPKYQGDRCQVRYLRRFTDPDGVTREEYDFCSFVGFKDIALLGKYPSLEAALSAKSFFD